MVVSLNYGDSTIDHKIPKVFTIGTPKTGTLNFGHLPHRVCMSYCLNS